MLYSIDRCSLKQKKNKIKMEIYKHYTSSKPSHKMNEEMLMVGIGLD